MRTKTSIYTVMAGALVLVGATACGSIQASGAAKAPALVLGDQGGSPGYTENFNPLSVNALEGWEFMYEPMYVVNNLNGQKTPWLATGYRWVNSRQLQFTIRSGVKWSNGKPFTAADVAYTFNLLKKHPSLDANGVWQFLSSVSASGNVVTFNFSHVDIPAWQYLATQAIVYPPQFSKVNPTTFTDPNPIVTGPYVVNHFNSSQYTLKKNPLYWQKSKIKVPAIKEIAVSGNTTSDLQLSEGKFDQAVLFEPGIQKAYASRNPSYHYWFPLASPVNLYFNLTKAPFNNVKFRQAMAYAINRNKIYKQGEYGYEPPANQSLLPPSLQKSWLDKSLAKKYPYAYNPKKALSLLASIGYHLRSGKLIGSNGQQLSFTLQVPTGWTDWIQDTQIIQKELGQLGINVSVQTPSVATDYSDVETGHFQAALVYGWSESNPYFIYDYILSKTQSAPVGQTATFNANSERWNSATTNSLINQLAATKSVAKQHQLVDAIQKVTFTKVPVVSLVYGASWNEYQTNHYVGWPTPKNPYADPSISWPDTLIEMTHLHPVK